MPHRTSNLSFRYQLTAWRPWVAERKLPNWTHGPSWSLFWRSSFIPQSQLCSPLKGAKFEAVTCSHSRKNAYLLIPWYWVHPKQLTGLQLVKKFPAFHGTRRFITALTSVRHLSLSRASPVQSTYPHPTSWRSILILSTQLRLGLHSGLFPSGAPTKTKLKKLMPESVVRGEVETPGISRLGSYQHRSGCRDKDRLLIPHFIVWVASRTDVSMMRSITKICVCCGWQWRSMSRQRALNVASLRLRWPHTAKLFIHIPLRYLWGVSPSIAEP